jgi:phenylpyruvate tautomerase
MPVLKMQTNVATADVQPTLLKQLSELMAKATGKPERYVMVDIQENTAMLFGGTQQPLAYLECKSIGLTPAQAKAISAAVAELLLSSLQLSAERIYIEFSNAPAEFWGWNGGTFA